MREIEGEMTPGSMNQRNVNVENSRNSDGGSLSPRVGRSRNLEMSMTSGTNLRAPEASPLSSRQQVQQQLDIQQQQQDQEKLQLQQDQLQQAQQNQNLKSLEERLQHLNL